MKNAKSLYLITLIALRIYSQYAYTQKSAAIYCFLFFSFKKIYNRSFSSIVIIFIFYFDVILIAKTEVFCIKCNLCFFFNPLQRFSHLLFTTLKHLLKHKRLFYFMFLLTNSYFLTKKAVKVSESKILFMLLNYWKYC